jgi:hypothetical protein
MYSVRNSEYKSQDQILISKIPGLTSSQVIVVVVWVHFFIKYLVTEQSWFESRTAI